MPINVNVGATWITMICFLVFTMTLLRRAVPPSFGKAWADVEKNWSFLSPLEKSILACFAILGGMVAGAVLAMVLVLAVEFPTINTQMISSKDMTSIWSDR